MTTSAQNDVDPANSATATADRLEVLDPSEGLHAVISAGLRDVAPTGLVSRSHAVDCLLDCFNAARVANAGDSVRLEIEAGLAEVGRRNAAPAEEFHAVLERIQLAVQIESAFQDVRPL